MWSEMWEIYAKTFLEEVFMCTPSVLLSARLVTCACAPTHAQFRGNTGTRALLYCDVLCNDVMLWRLILYCDMVSRVILRILHSTYGILHGNTCYVMIRYSMLQHSHGTLWHATLWHAMLCFDVLCSPSLNHEKLCFVLTNLPWFVIIENVILCYDVLHHDMVYDAKPC